ncbi:alcohol dehydrogenase catalytic domain-containing protein [Oscillochloris sp. ZM17-4]|uniref:MDR/zinc-dependent alcohol dehydrogenase-like family protein n=1 Tax=Oscillochloris sp. ZM17-4 TaxID=2866714 RepID=UPI001C73CD8A|nr:alcohol dehydrogenase catalytic domain-containing protein [Oscillochloris sp. ZM17-4]MBX0329555.1 alcohol dehydrogenase catalytic domain-containing protein [Oscillochloris sp. ZM17-4]
MHAIVFDGSLRLAQNHPIPALTPGEALIRPHLSGICNTDIEITRGYMGFRGVLGHEFVGTVEACDEQEWVGRRVVGEINAACLRCPTCLRGDQTHCPNRTTLGIDRRDGVMAELVSLPISCLHEVPDRVPDDAAVFTEPLAAALEILEQSHIKPTERVAVVGDGKLGAMIVQVLRLIGCEIALIGRHPERWALYESQGVRCTHSSSPPTPGQFDVVVDCTGNPAGLATARQLVRPRGRLVLKSTFEADSQLNLTMLVIDEVRLIGSRCGPFAPALKLLERGLIATAPLISAKYALSDGLAAFAAASGQMKVLLHHG